MQIPFATIISLRGGWNRDGDPVITLNLTDPGGLDSTHTLDLVFSQLAGEHRKAECDGWIEYLMDQIVLARQDAIRTDTAPLDHDTGIQPSIRRWVAHETIQPRANIAVSHPVPAKESTTLLIQPGSPPIPDAAEPTVSSVLPEKTGEEALAALLEDMQLHATVLPAARAIEESADTGRTETEQLNPVSQTPSDVTVIPDQPEDIAGSHEEKIFSDIQSTVPAGTPELEDMLPEVTEETPGVPETIPVTEPETREILTVPDAEPQVLRAPASPEPEGIVWPVIPTHGPASQDTNIPQEPEISGYEEIPAETAPPETPATPSPSPAPGSLRHPLFLAIAICVIILAIAGGALFYSMYLAGNSDKAHTPEVIPTPTIVQTPVLPVVTIPTTGIWVRLESNSTFLGTVGIPGSLKMVSGSGNQFYQIRQPDGAVQASFQKQGYTGDPMTVEVYNNGKLVAHRITTAPRGSIDFILDPKTGEPPGIPLNRT